MMGSGTDAEGRRTSDLKNYKREGAIMAEDMAEATNTQRLLTLLVPDSLAARLVNAFAQTGEHDRDTAMKSVLMNHLSEIARTYDHTEN
jgi:hypothetical protein